MSEVRPSSRENVHHAVVYIRPPDSKWLRHAPVGVPFTASDLTDARIVTTPHWTDSDILLVYAPGKFARQLARWHGEVHSGRLRSRLSDALHHATAMLFETRRASEWSSPSSRRKQRVLTLQLTNDRFVIPPGVDDYRVEVHGTLPNDARCLAFLPHLHLRGKRFEYNIVHQDGSIETLLRVNYDFSLAVELSPGGSATAEGGNEASSRRVVRQFAQQSAQSRSGRGGALGRSDVR